MHTGGTKRLHPALLAERDRPCWSPALSGLRQARRAAGGPDTPAYAALAGVADPARRPPAYIEVAQLDMFRDEDLAYALRPGQAGVPVEFHLHSGAPHEFDFIAFNITAARRHRRPHSFEHRMPLSLTGGSRGR
jgi:acetyl esterase/lipase